MTRKMATLRQISEIKPIENADNIELAIVDGWQVVTKKGDFKKGDTAIYCEIDSWIPHNVAPFLSGNSKPREYEGVKGQKLRTIKLRGEYSQGLVLPISLIDVDFEWLIGDDVSQQLGILKYEAPIPACLAGQVKGIRPHFVPKTDQERIQNIFRKIDFPNHTWEVTEKMEGSSMSVYLNGDDFGVTSRNMDLTETEGNTFWKVCRENNIEEKIRNMVCDLEYDVVIQGELVGEGIQGNIHGIKGHKFFVYDIFNIGMGEYIEPSSCMAICNEYGLETVPIIFDNYEFRGDLKDLLDIADGKTYHNPKKNREGLVFKSNERHQSFKVISNKYLLKQD